ncbi:MAG TPA: hypothetical protein VM328_02695 [Fimbriimonadaceae bacterium]|nr:hypothetical protein [Fimbriimonadaceae bacterium]
MDYTAFKLTIAVLATIGLYSVLYRENKFYRFWEHVFLGLAAGWAIVALWTESLKEGWYDKMVGSTGETVTPGFWPWALLLPIGLMGYLVFSRKHNWMSRIPIGIILGLWSGQQIQVWWTRYGPQIHSSMKPVFPTSWERFTAPATLGNPAYTATEAAEINARIYPSEAITNLIFVFTLIAVLSYFLFSFEHKTKFMRGLATSGRWLLMIGFGAIFGSTVMMRFSLLIDRMYFVWIEWLNNTILGRG